MSEGIAIEAGELTKTMRNIFDAESERIKEAQREVTKDIAKETADKLKGVSPSKSGDYAKGWSYRPEKVSGYIVSFTVHNKTGYQLTHLLEKGHAGRNQYTTFKDVKAHEHIKPVADEMCSEYMKRLKEASKA